MGIRYIVTGAAGHLESTVIRLLQNTDSEVYGLLLPEEKPVIKAPNIHYVHGDVCRKETLSPLFENADMKTVKAIHTAGIISIEREVSPLVSRFELLTSSLSIQPNLFSLTVAFCNVLPQTQSYQRFARFACRCLT